MNNIDFKCLFESSPGLYLILNPDLSIAAVSDAYLVATMTNREIITGHNIFKIFPDNPDDLIADGVSNLRSSLNHVLKNRNAHTMAVQKYDIRRPDGSFEVRFWSPVNKPVFNNENELIFIIHSVEDVTDFIRLKKDQEIKNKISEGLSGRVHEMEMEIYKRAQEIQHINLELEKKVKELLHAKNQLAQTVDRVSFLASIAENIQDPVITSDNDYFITRWNHAAEKLLEWNSAEVIGKSAADVLNVIYGEQTQQQIRSSFAEKGFWQGEVIYHTKSGAPLNVMVTASRLKNTQGNVTGNLILVKDITGRKKGENALNKLNEELEERVKERTTEIAKSEKRFRALIENNYDVISLMDESFKIIYRSPSAVRITGWTDEELRNIEGTKNIHPDDHEKAKNIVIELMANPDKAVSASFRNLHKLGHYIWVEGTIVNLLHDEDVKAIVFNFRDVIERIEAEEKLTASEIRFRSLIENSTEAISLTDAANNVIYRSPSAHKITGLLPEENLAIRIHAEDAATIKNKIGEVLTKPDVPIFFQARFLHKTGHYYWLEGTITNMLHLNGVNAIVYNYHDITQRKELEDLLHKANVLARIGGWEVDLIKGTVYWSDITREIHETEPGYIPDVATGINFYKQGEARDIITQKVKEAIELGKPWDVELPIITAKNNERWIRTIGGTEFVNGKCIKICGSFQDIDNRKKAEEKLIESEKLYRNLFTNMLHGFAYCKAIYKDGILTDYTYLAVNSEYEALTGLKNLSGKNMSAVMPNLLTSDPLYAELMNGVIVSGKSEKFETYVQPLDKWFSVSLYSPEKGYFVSLVDNITHRKEAEQKILKANRLYSFISQINQNIVHVKDEEILFRNSCQIAFEFGKFKMA